MNNSSRRRRAAPLARTLLALGLLGTASSAAVAAPMTAPGYTVTLLAKPPSGASAADSVLIADGAIFVGFGNHHKPDGSDGLSSTIAKYSMAGKLRGTVNVLGHNDGLRYDPARHVLWANENEDAHPHLVLIDPANLRITATYSVPNPHGGGYDDDVFVGGKAFITASNPAKNPNTEPALIEAKLPASGTVLSIKPVLMGTARAVGATDGKPMAMNLTDPDGIAPMGKHGVMFTSEGDKELVLVRRVGTARQQVALLKAHQQIDDIAVAPAGSRELLFTDTVTNDVYVLRGPFAAGTAYTVGNGADGVAHGKGNISAVDLKTGVFTPILRAASPGGIVFVAGH